MNDDKKKELLMAFNDNTEMKEAVFEELFSGIVFQGVIKEGSVVNPLQNWALSLVLGPQRSVISNEQLGADLRATAEGIAFLQSAWNKITDNFKRKATTGTGTKNKNPGV